MLRQLQEFGVVRKPRNAVPLPRRTCPRIASTKDSHETGPVRVLDRADMVVSNDSTAYDAEPDGRFSTQLWKVQVKKRDTYSKVGC